MNKKNGKWIVFNQAGTKIRIENFKNSFRDGKTIVKYPNGSMHEEIEYKNGMLHGRKKSYNKRNKLIYDAEYKNNKLIKIHFSEKSKNYKN